MAQKLSNKEVAYKTLTKTSTFINKILSLGTYGPDFATEDGLFCSDFATVTFNDPDKSKGKRKLKFTYKRQSSPVDNERLARQYILQGPFVKDGGKIEVTGKFFGSSARKTLRVSRFLKTAEFGGQGAGSNKVNLGTEFEKTFFKRLDAAASGIKMLNEKTKKGLDSYSKAVSYILHKTSGPKNTGGKASPAKKIDGVEDTGGKNTSRPIKATKASLYISPSVASQHGKLLSDIDIHHASGSTSHLSLKYGKTLTFINAGVMQIFKESEIRNNEILNDVGLNILAAFGIDKTIFCDVFNKYGTQSFRKDSGKVQLTNTQKKLLRSFLKTGIGSGYWMVHGQENQSVDFYYMDDMKNQTASTPPDQVQINYGGAGGKAKRIDVEFSTPYFDFKMNIRNKQSGVYPSHIMLDYTTKSAIGKTNIQNSSTF